MSAEGAASLAERAYLAIRDKIVALELRPGAVVSEKALTEELGIGRTPVREALR
ncbi:MAG: GntR family transcriptional regulator, partial [Actinobacteria bacterium]|nr:GntR family transcriptional regulator [Actinomycetota bacterium]